MDPVDPTGSYWIPGSGRIRFFPLGSVIVARYLFKYIIKKRLPLEKVKVRILKEKKPLYSLVMPESTRKEEEIKN
jgi:hypothetical protein